ncbi:hypothetical protein [Novosphingobium sp.]|uniref:hypothetical protein n=1 Tax=Novosphingobium sp. TaxID=1874826 RepID=UPI001D2D53BC|nr:hypothetical protein [Novosphingobium sp.]MBX9663730.1 hypothetical protein [Novosphingobium sp.]
MLSVVAPAFLLAAGGTTRDQQFGAWQGTEVCAHDADSFGCTRTLRQSTPNLDVILIFRDSFAIRATVRSCDQEATRVSFTPDPKEWKQLSLAKRIDRTKQVLTQWADASVIGCSHPAALSFDGFENGFSRLDAAASADVEVPAK